MGDTHNVITGTVGSAVQVGGINGRASIGVRLQVGGQDVALVDQNVLATLDEHLRTRVTELQAHLPHSRAALDEVEAVLAIVEGRRR